MSRYIDAERIDWRLIIPTNVTIAEENMIHLAKKLVERQPTADVVDVVRCGDCVNWQKDWSVDLYGSHYCPHMDTRTMEDDYCSYGERREDEQIH